MWLCPTHVHNEVNERTDDYRSITQINKDIATQSLSIFTPYHVSLNILRWMIGPFSFYSKRGIIIYCQQRDTEQATLDNIQYRNNWHGGTHH